MTSGRVRGWSPSTMTTADGGRLEGGGRRDADLERARQVARVGVADAVLVEPLDAVLDLVGGVAEDDDDFVDPGLADRVEDVLEDRPAVEAGKRLRRAEPARRARREDDGGDRHPAAAPTGALAAEAAAPGAPRPFAVSTIGRPDPP